MPLHIKLFHGVGSAAYGIKDNGFGTFLLLFYNQVIGLDAWLVSLVLAVAMVADGFIDPVIGHYSDRTYTRWGKRLPWLYTAAIPLAFAWMLLWAPPEGLGNMIFAYLLVVAILVRLCVSAIEVPAAALIPELTTDYDERTSVMRFRHLFAWGSGLIMLFLAYNVFLVPDQNHAVGQLNKDGYWKFGLFGAIAMAAAVVISAMGQHKRVAHLPAAKPAKVTVRNAFNEIKESLSHPAAVILLSSALLLFASQGTTFAISNYLFLFVWEFSGGVLSLYPIMLFCSVVGSFFLVSPLTRRFGKRPVAIIAGIVGLLFWTLPFILLLLGYWPETGSMQSTIWVFAAAFCANLGFVIMMITAQSMVADIVEASQEETGRRAEGVFSAGWFFTQKCGTAAGILICGLIVQLSGLPAKAVPGAVSWTIIEKFVFSYCLIIAVLAIISTLIMSRFPISRDDHKARLEKISSSGGGEAPAALSN